MYLKALYGPVCVALVSLAQIASAGVTVSFETGTINETTALTGFSTTGAQMDGMVVTAYFANGFSQALSWADIDHDSGGVSGSGWSLREDGDTFAGAWKLVNTSGVGLTRLLLDAGPGNSVFDTSWGPYGLFEGTPGSAEGRTFAVAYGLGSLNVSATYRDAIALTGQAPVGDLYRELDIVFLGSGYGGGKCLPFCYRADTDNLKFGGDLKPIAAPGAIVLGVAGLWLIHVFRRRLG